MVTDPPTIQQDTWVSCDGRQNNLGDSGHPLVFIAIPQGSVAHCPYCNQVFSGDLAPEGEPL